MESDVSTRLLMSYWVSYIRSQIPLHLPVVGPFTTSLIFNCTLFALYSTLLYRYLPFYCTFAGPQLEDKTITMTACCSLLDIQVVWSTSSSSYSQHLTTLVYRLKGLKTFRLNVCLFVFQYDTYVILRFRFTHYPAFTCKFHHRSIHFW